MFAKAHLINYPVGKGKEDMSIDVCVVGGGMIVHDQILPSLYHLQRTGAIGQIDIAATSSARIRDLLNERFERAFPGQSFRANPPAGADPGERQPDLYKEVVAGLAPRNLVLVATPDPLHYEMVRFALEHDQHVLCVKPLVQTIKHAFELEKLARERGLFVGIEYHKRFDRRALEAREFYRQGRFGQFRCGEAKVTCPPRSDFKYTSVKGSRNKVTNIFERRIWSPVRFSIKSGNFASKVLGLVALAVRM
jgi:predicted dehydrogenase